MKHSDQYESRVEQWMKHLMTGYPHPKSKVGYVEALRRVKQLKYNDSYCIKKAEEEFIKKFNPPVFLMSNKQKPITKREANQLRNTIISEIRCLK